MLMLYLFRVNEEFRRVRECAELLRGKFQAEVNPQELLTDVRNLASLCSNLTELLPHEVRHETYLRRHLAFMEKYLSEGDPESCKSDIADICGRDVPGLEHRFQDWCTGTGHYDQQLVEQVKQLFIRGEYDSAIRKAFVILKDRLVVAFRLSKKLDGAELVNTLFGKTGKLASKLEDSERQAMRDLLAGLYGVFRNRYGHENLTATWYEAEAVLSVINVVLHHIETYRTRRREK